MELGEVRTERKSGTESFHIDGESLSFDLLSFWQWSSSEVLGNALRGILAEYIVALDIRCAEGIRSEWDAYDLTTSKGTKVEVKSASYLQTWKQRKYSSISFGIQPTMVWEDNKAGHIRSKEFQRRSDVYVFCVLAHKDQATVDPLNLNQWDFYVLPTTVLNEKVREQKTITLSSLLKLKPTKCCFGEIRDEIDRVCL